MMAAHGLVSCRTRPDLGRANRSLQPSQPQRADALAFVRAFALAGLFAFGGAFSYQRRAVPARRRVHEAPTDEEREGEQWQDATEKRGKDHDHGAQHRSAAGRPHVPQCRPTHRPAPLIPSQTVPLLATPHRRLEVDSSVNAEL